MKQVEINGEMQWVNDAGEPVVGPVTRKELQAAAAALLEAEKPKKAKEAKEEAPQAPEV